jgi:hypothetical protein
MGEGCGCCCSGEETKSAEDMIRDLINLIAVYKEEELEGVTTKIEPNTAEILSAKLKEIAEKMGSC